MLISQVRACAATAIACTRFFDQLQRVMENVLADNLRFRSYWRHWCTNVSGIDQTQD